MRRESTIIIFTIALAGCVDGFRGANVQIDLSPGTPVQARVGGMMGAGELPANAHFTIVGIQHGSSGDRLFELERFEVHRIVDPTSPCFIDVGEHVPHPGLHVTAYQQKIAEDTGIADIANPPASATDEQKAQLATAMQRMINVQKLASDAGIKVVASASTATYPAVAPSCTGAENQIPPPTCTDDASNQRRLTLCQAAWKADPNLFEGTDRILTSPLNGVTRGMVDGANPINMGPVGGAQFFVDESLDGIDAYAIYTQADGADGFGQQLLYGEPTTPTRGVRHVHMTDPAVPALTAEMAIFIDLGEDDVHF